MITRRRGNVDTSCDVLSQHTHAGDRRQILLALGSLVVGWYHWRGWNPQISHLRGHILSVSLKTLQMRVLVLQQLLRHVQSLLVVRVLLSDQFTHDQWRLDSRFLDCVRTVRSQKTFSRGSVTFTFCVFFKRVLNFNKPFI